MSEEKERYERCAAAYDAAQRLHARQVENKKAAAKVAEMYAARGKALHQVKEFARVGFMLAPGATEEAFEQLWRQAFQVNGREPKDSKK
jgi:hypothetical protein